jgi:outer membrane protein insertion porin family
MQISFSRALALSALFAVAAPALAAAQAPGQPAPAPANPPPPASAPAAGEPVPYASLPVLTTTPCKTPLRMPSAPVEPNSQLVRTYEPPPGQTFFWSLELCFPTQGNSPTIEENTYLYYIKLKDLLSLPSQGKWVPYDDKIEQAALADFNTLMKNTSFLDDMSVEVTDYTFPNGAIGKIITYNMEERERIKVINYEGSKAVDRAKIEEELTNRSIELRSDGFLDDRVLRRVEGVVRDLMAEKGFTNAEVTHKVTPVSEGSKTVNVTFTIGEGPKIKIRRIDFVGNQAIGDGTLQRKMKENKPKGFLSFITGTGTYKETKFEEDAQKVVDYYRQKGYVRARVGNPELKVLENTKDGKTRWVELRIPVTEGPRYRVGSFSVAGNTIFQSDPLREQFKLKIGDWFDEKKLRDGLRKVQEAYGSNGYMEFTGFPDYRFSDDPQAIEAALNALVPDAIAAPPEPETKEAKTAPTVDITMQLTEGKQYLVNRITFTGNTTTRDNVIRREVRLLEGRPFDTEALKYSVKRLNQLGYFKTLEGNEKDLKVDKVPDKDGYVDVTLKLEEQNRNQLTFGAGVSQYEGVFGQLSFQTANFLGRGESLTLSLQAGDRAQNYQLAFTEPFLFDRNMTGGFDIYKRNLQYIGYYTQRSSGGNLMFGFPVGAWSRMFMTYSYEQVRITDLSEALLDPSCLTSSAGCTLLSSLGDLSQLTPTQREQINRNPFLVDSLLIGQGGTRTISKVVPTFVENTVDNPIFPTTGKKLTATIDLAVLGGNTQYLKPSLEAIWFHRLSGRTSVGFRANWQYIQPVGKTDVLPVFERLFLGGEYSVRGFDIRSIGPTAPNSLVVLGGNKSLLFNAEYLITIAGPVRLVLFGDAGQVRDVGENFAWKENVTQLVPPPTPLLYDRTTYGLLVDPNAPGLTTQVVGRAAAFKTSVGAEIRFFMPVLNVPFRLIYAWNPSRANVLDNQLQPAKDKVFRFAVGTTF